MANKFRIGEFVVTAEGTGEVVEQSGRSDQVYFVMLDGASYPTAWTEPAMTSCDGPKVT